MALIKRRVMLMERAAAAVTPAISTPFQNVILRRNGGKVGRGEKKTRIQTVHFAVIILKQNFVAKTRFVTLGVSAAIRSRLQSVRPPP